MHEVLGLLKELNKIEYNLDWYHVDCSADAVQVSKWYERQHEIIKILGDAGLDAQIVDAQWMVGAK